MATTPARMSRSLWVVGEAVIVRVWPRVKVVEEVMAMKASWGALCLGLLAMTCGRDPEQPSLLRAASRVGVADKPQDENPPAETDVTTPVEEARPSTEPTRQRVYYLDERLRLNEIQLKGSHNSYHLRPWNNLDPAWQYDLPSLTEQFDAYSVRAVELDLHYVDGQVQVFHLSGYDDRTTCLALHACLAEIRAWSDAHRAHAPMFIFFEFKDETDPHKLADHLEEIESVIVDAFPRECVYTPDDLVGNEADVQSALQKYGWPVLGTVRGKIIFVLHEFGLARHRYTYGGNGLWGRRMWVSAIDMSWRHAGILAFDEPAEGEMRIKDMVARGFIVRTRSDDLPTFGGDRWVKFAAALRSGAQIILTDYPVPWYIPEYDMHMPGGRPVRCNPITAPRGPGECDPLGIENPQFLNQPGAMLQGGKTDDSAK